MCMPTQLQCGGIGATLLCGDLIVEGARTPGIWVGDHRLQRDGLRLELGAVAFSEKGV
jgi:hypothetical protein